MNGMRGLVAALAMLLAGTAFAAKPNTRGISAWIFPAYTIYSHDKRKAYDAAERMALVEVVLSKLMIQQRRSNGIPTHVLLVRDSIYRRYLSPGNRISAEFIPTRFSNYLLVNASEAEEQFDRAVDHEYTHSFLRNFYDGLLPAWFDEGLATLIEASQILRNSIRIGFPELYRGPRWLPIDRLLRLDKQSEEYLSTETDMFHFESWAIVHRGLLYDREFGRQMFAYLGAIKAGMPVDEAVQKSFGLSIQELDRLIRGYARRDQFPVARLSFERPEPPKMESGLPLSELEGLDLLARTMLDANLHPDRLGEVIAAAKEQGPDDPRPLVLQLRMEARKGNGSAIDSLVRLLEPMAVDPAVSRAVGLALFEGVRPQLTNETPLQGASLAKASRAFELLDRAERALPVDAESAWAFGLLAAGLERELVYARERLDLAHQTTPRHADLAMASVLVCQRLQRSEETTGHLENVALYARTEELRQWAVRRLPQPPR